MEKYNKQIAKLLDQEAEKIKSNVYFFTAYLPVKSYSKLQTKKRLKSLVLKTLRNHKKLKKFSSLHHYLVKKAFQKINKLDSLKKGLAFFAKIDLQRGKAYEIRDKNITTFPVSRQPKKEAYIGKTFDLDQLIWIKNTAAYALVVNLERQKCLFYALEGGKLRRLSCLKNKFVKTKEGEYLEKFAPLPKKGILYSTGADKEARRTLKENRRFINNLKLYIKQNKRLKTGFEYLIFFYSESFAELIESFEKYIKTVFPSSTPLFIQKNIQKESRLKRAAIKQIKKFQKTVKKDLLALVKENQPLFVQGWSKTAKAARQKKIETLFIKPTVRKRGYLYKKEFIYTYPIKDSRMVKDIAPWLVKTVVDTSGRVVIIKDDGIMPEVEVAAKLRY